ncbi:zinc finger MYM-type protein 1-like [Leptopilina boulardi]|uniref:zinc finger MYM-type protein 1-like n=1 Tax=Leptopilina boulardi TaxID=63433 RepID=UPI0021F56CD9|nr:zinc finger MYM-type protein 1-like [Leptopilina boulardi]
MSGPSRKSDAVRKWESGASKRKRKAAEALSNEAMSSTMIKFLKKSSNDSTVNSDESVSQNIVQENNVSKNITEEVFSTEMENKSDSEYRMMNDPSENENVLEEIDFTENKSDENKEPNSNVALPESLISTDPGKWPFFIMVSHRLYLIEIEPYKNSEIQDDYYPKDIDKRHFSNSYYVRKLSNGESQQRKWLVYSESQNKVYCFPCKLFSNSQTHVVREGCDDWRHLSNILKKHENNQEHMLCMFKWMEFHKAIKLGKTIDMENERLLQESQKYWYNVFQRLVDVINFLASHNLAFRGHRESKYDHVLSEHLQNFNEKKIRQSYMSPEIQNELITLMSKSLIDKVIEKVKQAKYFAFMLDCTRDVSRTEQMSIILRFCNALTGELEEHFIGFIAASETTGEFITKLVLNELEKHGLDIQNCRGQGYDNGANMVGINKGILNINPRAFFTPCGCHSWNLILVDAAKSSSTATTFFGYIQKIYLLFSLSSKRWELLKDKLKLTLKSLSDTRWESRISAVKAIILQFDKIIDCIIELKDQTKEADVLCDCEGVLKEMLTFEFIVSIHVWYEVLLRVNNISKIWQSVQINLNVDVDYLRDFKDWLQEYRNSGYERTLAEARQFREKSAYEISPDF